LQKGFRTEIQSQIINLISKNQGDHTKMNTMPAYEVPSVETYTDAELLEALGPAQAQTRSGGDPCQVGPNSDCGGGEPPVG
jgi:hypothetical protein